MKYLVWFLLRHDLLPKSHFLRRRLLRSIFKPLNENARDYSDGITGFYDLGQYCTREQVERFLRWESEK